VTRFLERQGIDVVGTAGDGEEALRLIEQLLPRVAIIDLRMPGFSGAEIIRRARMSAPETALLVYTGLIDHATITDALEAGAHGVIQKDASLLELVRAVRLVAGGRTYIDASLASTLLRGTGVVAALTARELEVLRLLADGNSNEAIARELHIAPDTVRAHVRKAMAKLGSSTRTQAVATALRQSLIS
jgi:DNA-binding NarL/FixJ family response regulator